MSRIVIATVVPVCVDLDGTLTPVDTLHESLLRLVRQDPLALLSVLPCLVRGKAAFKRAVAALAPPDPALLPVRADLLAWLRAERAKGRPVYLTTASDEHVAQEIARHLGVFDGVVASDGVHNLSSGAKRDALVRRFGERGFDYVGNEVKDLPVWAAARSAIVVGSAALRDRAARGATLGWHLDTGRPGPATYLGAMRLHQWVKNLLVFVPAITHHAILQGPVLLASALAFLAFGLCASSVYVINDLLDLDTDRAHPRKRERAFAAGRLSARRGVALAAVLTLAAVAIAMQVGPLFGAALGAYYVFTWAYSVRLKRAAIVDVLALAGLYTLRIIAGSAATAIAPSFWLLALSMFAFLSLGVAKRYAEISDPAIDLNRGRGYRRGDLPLLQGIGVGSGLCAVVVMALYVNSSDSQRLYRHAELLWLVCPLTLYWIMRVWLLASRGELVDDPVVFAVSDRLSLATFAVIGAIVLAAV